MYMCICIYRRINMNMASSVMYLVGGNDSDGISRIHRLMYIHIYVHVFTYIHLSFCLSLFLSLFRARVFLYEHRIKTDLFG